MAKLTLTPVTNLSSGSAVGAINTNYDRIEAAFENVLSRDGSTPNQMNADIDLNSNDLLNAGTISTNNLLVDGAVIPSLGDVSDVYETAVEAAASASSSAAIALAAANSNLVFATRASAVSATIPLSINSVTLKGDVAESDGLGGLWTSTNNGNTDTFTSNGGTRTWYRVKDVPRERLSVPLGHSIVVNITEYGAKSDFNFGTQTGTDAAAALQAALDEQWQRGGGVVRIPTGPFLLASSQVKMRNKVYVECAPGAEVYRGQLTTMFGTVDGAYPETQQMGYDAFSEMGWEGGLIHLNSVYLNDSANGFAAAHGRNLRVMGATFRDVMGVHALDMNGIDRLHVEDCRFEGWIPDPVNFPGLIREAIQVTYASGDDTPTRRSKFKNNYFGPSPTAGVGAWPTGIGNHGSHFGKYVEDIMIEGNTFDQMLYAGVRAYTWKGLTVRGNTFDACDRGVLLSNAVMNSSDTIDAAGVQRVQAYSCEDIWITGNRFLNIVRAPIQGIASVGDSAVMAGRTIPWMRNINVQGNRIVGPTVTTGGAINLQWVDGLWLKDNYIANAYRGMYLGFIKNGYVDDNRMINAVERGIYLLEPNNGDTGDWTWAQNVGNTANCHIDGNSVLECGTHGITVANLKGGTVKDNITDGISRAANNVSDALRIEGGCASVKVKDNLTKLDAGNGQRYGLVVSGSASDITVGDNELAGKTGARTVTTAATRGEAAILREFADDTAAAAGTPPVAIDSKYKTGSTVKVRVT